MSKFRNNDGWAISGVVLIILFNLAWLSFLVWAIYELVTWVTTK